MLQAAAHSETLSRTEFGDAFTRVTRLVRLKNRDVSARASARVLSILARWQRLRRHTPVERDAVNSTIVLVARKRGLLPRGRQSDVQRLLRAAARPVSPQASALARCTLGLSAQDLAFATRSVLSGELMLPPPEPCPLLWQLDGVLDEPPGAAGAGPPEWGPLP